VVYHHDRNAAVPSLLSHNTSNKSRTRNTHPTIHNWRYAWMNNANSTVSNKLWNKFTCQAQNTAWNRHVNYLCRSEKENGDCLVTLSESYTFAIGLMGKRLNILMKVDIPA